jgi:hypothetical protein
VDEAAWPSTSDSISSTKTLLVPSLDEVSTEYGLLAEAVIHPADFSSVTYRLRPGSEMVRRAAGYD